MWYLKRFFNCFYQGELVDFVFVSFFDGKKVILIVDSESDDDDNKKNFEYVWFIIIY